MKKILFVGHTFHKTSLSSAFFVKELEAHFDVNLFFVEPETLKLEDLPDGDYHLVVLWQIDFLAPLFIVSGFKTVVVPMYDASAGLPELHWRLMREALLLNFSINLHMHCVRMGCRTLHARYFPNPDDFVPVDDFDTLRGFIWQRRPDEINVELIDRLLGDSLDTLHVHNAPDYGEANPLPNTRVGFGRCKVTTTTWFETKADYLTTLKGSNVYFAPRLAEGIGMGYLEAMAQGMVVIANAMPTHNEYITSGYNGILIDAASSGTISLEDPHAIGQKARETVVLGYRHWRLQVDAVIDAFKDFAAPRQPKMTSLMGFANLSINAYLSSVPEYARFLDTTKDDIEFYILERLEAARALVSEPDDQDEGIEAMGSASIIPGALAGSLHLTFGQGSAAPYCEVGWSTPEGGHTWIEGKTGIIQLPGSIALKGHRVTMTIDAFTAPPIKDLQEVEIILAGHSIAKVPMDYTYEHGGVIQITTPEPVPDCDTIEIEFRCGSVWEEPNNGRSLSIALRSMSLVRDESSAPKPLPELLAEADVHVAQSS
ncbi:MAG: glycosyltransferase [Pseudomonadota bacterium]